MQRTLTRKVSRKQAKGLQLAGQLIRGTHACRWDWWLYLERLFLRCGALKVTQYHVPADGVGSGRGMHACHWDLSWSGDR